MYEVRGAKGRAATRIDSVRDLVRIPRRSRANKLRHGNTARGNRGPLLRSRRFQGFLTRECTQGDGGALNKTRIKDQVRLERHMRLLKGLYTRGGLSLKLGTKGEMVNEAKYSTGSRKEA